VKLNTTLPPVHLRRGAGQVDQDIAPLHLDARLDEHVPPVLHLLHHALGLVDAVRDFFDLQPHAPLSAADDLVCQVVEVLEAVFPEHLAYFLGADVVRRDLRPDVAGHLLGCPHVPADHLQDGLIGDAPLVELHQGDEEALLEDFMVVRGDAAADVRVVEDAGGKSDEPPSVEDGAHDADIVEVARQGPRVVRDEDVPRRAGFRRKPGDEALDAEGHGPGLARGREGALGQLAASPVGEHAGVIVGVAEQARESGAGHGAVRLVHDGNQSAPEDLQGNRVENCSHGHASSKAIHKNPNSSVRTRASSPATAVDSLSSMMAGPRKAAPGKSLYRS